MKLLLLSLCFLLALGATGYPWGGDGHRAIAEAARELTLTPEVAAKVRQILGNDDLAAIAGWLDDVRLAHKRHSGPLRDDPAAAQFNARFPQNEVWHYIDLPVGTTTYAATSPFASPEDIVHAMHHAIDVLEGHASDMTSLEALKVLVHLVGDVHQPLHCAAGYFDVSDRAHPQLVSDPARAARLPHDRGGNQLFYSGPLQLHALWDNELVGDLIHATPGQPLAGVLRAEAAAHGDQWLTPGDYHQWPEKWVEDTAAQAIEAYRGLAFGAATVRADRSIDRIETTLPAGYIENELPRARTQLAKAAAHLAQLLNRLRFQ